ncbi:MAG: TolC family protein, partial [Comamonas sp.]
MINRCTPVALAAALLMAGCSFIPTYERPAAPVPAAYSSAPQGAADASAQAAAALPWQEYFTDARLQQLIGLALTNNRDLQVAVLNIEQARAQYRITRADQFPTINGGMTASRAPD